LPPSANLKRRSSKFKSIILAWLVPLPRLIKPKEKPAAKE